MSERDGRESLSFTQEGKKALNGLYRQFGEARASLGPDDQMLILAARRYDDFQFGDRAKKMGAEVVDRANLTAVFYEVMRTPSELPQISLNIAKLLHDHHPAFQRAKVGDLVVDNAVQLLAGKMDAVAKLCRRGDIRRDLAGNRQARTDLVLSSIPVGVRLATEKVVARAPVEGRDTLSTLAQWHDLARAETGGTARTHTGGAHIPKGAFDLPAPHAVGGDAMKPGEAARAAAGYNPLDRFHRPDGVPERKGARAAVFNPDK